MGWSGAEGEGTGTGADVKLPPLCGFIETTLIDWEGVVAAEVFLCGCNLRCPFCHSAHIVFGRVEPMSWEQIETSIVERINWIDGVVISGGEPTLHGNALVELCRRFKEKGLSIKLDTNGTNPELLRDLHKKGLLDFIALDFKAPLDERYSIAVGVEIDTGTIEDTLFWLLKDDGPSYEIRTTVVPRLHDLKTLKEMAHQIKGAADWVLQNFNPKNGCLNPEWEKEKPYPLTELRRWAEHLSGITPCRVRGVF